MRTLYFIIEKEFKQLLRSKGLVRTLFLTPIIQLLLMPMAANFSVKNINIAFIDQDHSSLSTKMIQKITASGHFKLVGEVKNTEEGIKLIESDKADLFIEIPNKFEENFYTENASKLNIQINAIEGVKAGLGGAYIGSILADFNSEAMMHFIQPTHISASPGIQTITINWYNQYLNYYLFIIPGILVNLITGIGLMQAAFNMVKEKEIGTIEQINVTPIKRQYFILGKLIPFYLLATIIFSIGILISFIVYRIFPVGSFISLYISLFSFLFPLIGFGLLLSTYSDSQQQMMSLGFFFMNVLNMLSGLFTNIDSMPMWSKFLSGCFPLSHFIQTMRMIMIKGSSLWDVRFHLFVMLGIGLIFNLWAILNYRKRN